jgi:mannose/cellobiose epimerase-like protein (N-acyl-D-glucosamine 2-epimerase family)
MSTPTRATLLEPGHETEWAVLNEEKRRTLTPPPDTPVEELLRHGIALSRQAFLLLRAVERAANERSARPA